jgi:hypothetical protein
MGKRSRLAAAPRVTRLSLEQLNPLRAIAFCFLMAVFAERDGAANAIDWMCRYCYMSEKEAAESIAIGRRVTGTKP